MKKISLLAFPILLVSVSAMASSLQLQLGNKAAQIRMTTGSGFTGYGGGRFSLSLFGDSHSDVMGSAGFMVHGLAAGQSPMSFGLGVKGYAVHIKSPDKNIQAIALGGAAKYTIPANMPMAVDLKGFYAPEITTFDQGKSLTDLDLNYDITVTPGATAFAGYRFLQTRIKNASDYSLDDAFHIGIKLNF